MNVLSLFSGIGGLDLGLKVAVPESRVVCYVERDPYCRRVLLARMADGSLDAAPIWDDVTTFDGVPWQGVVDCVIGGWPCQDISNAGKREGIREGNRSGLWFEVARLLREVRPGLFFGENVAALLGRGMDTVLGDLSGLGFDAEWGVVSASDVGAPHLRKRVFILAYSRHQPGATEPGQQQEGREVAAGAGRGVLADCGCKRLEGNRKGGATARPVGRGSGAVVADPEGQCGELRSAEGERPGRPAGGGGSVEHPIGQCGERRGAARDVAGASGRLEGEARERERGGAAADGAELGVFPPGPADRDGWAAILRHHPYLAPAIEEGEAERVFRGVAYGFPDELHRSRRKKRVARLKALGNAVCPIQAAAAFTELFRRVTDGR